MSEKTHYRKAFDSPYLSSEDIIEPTNLTIAVVRLEPDKTKRTKVQFNTAYFKQEFLRPGEKLKPMILNVTNCKMLKKITGSHFIEDWCVPITVYCDPTIVLKKEVVGGLCIMPPKTIKPTLTPENAKGWANAKAAFRRDGNLFKVFERVTMSIEHQEQLLEECYQAGENV